MNKLKYSTSKHLSRFRHGFFGRNGGYSSGQYSSLNCGKKTEDNLNTVINNLELVTKTLGTHLQNLAVSHQIHSAKVAKIENANLGDKFKVDGMITKTPSVALGVLTADCQPILFADPDSGVVGVAHAGWKGTLEGIIENTVHAMVAMGASYNNIRATIGPAISQINYEVGHEFREEFLNADEDSRPYFKEDSAHHLYFDLTGYGSMRLSRVGIQHIEKIESCTYANSEEYFSYRRSKHQGETATGLMISVIIA